MLGPLVVKSANCLPFLGSSEVCDSVQSLEALVFLHTLTKTSPLGPFPPPKPPYPAIKAEEHCLFDVLITKVNFPLLRTIYVVYKDKPFLFSSIAVAQSLFHLHSQFNWTGLCAKVCITGEYKMQR